MDNESNMANPTEALHATVVDRYQKHLNPGLAKLMNFAGFGVEVMGEGAYLFDHEGKRYLDCLGSYGVFSLGHRHPKVVEAVKKQLDTMPLSGKVFFSAKAAHLASRLADLTPGDLQYTFFSNSGAEAVEAAIKFGKAATGRHKIVSTIGSYHGKTLGALATTGREKYRKPFEPLMPGVEFVPFGDAEAAVRAIDGETALMMIEPVQGEGGIVIPPDGYLRSLREACDRHGALLMADEVQTGLGRTGYWFGVNHDGVTPDIMTLAKALGGGVMPIGATIGTARVWEVFSENPVVHTSTFGGNPMACAAGLATLEVIEEEGLVHKSTAVGEIMLAALRTEAARHPDLVKEVRGRGLMIGAEFQMDEVGEVVIAQMTQRGVVAAYTLGNPRVLRFEPPLIIGESEALQAAEVFGQALAATSELLAALA